MTHPREEITWKPLQAGAFMDGLGPVKAARDVEGDFVYALDTTGAHANVLGQVHGGVIASLLDQTVAMVAWHTADRAPTVTVQMDTRFVAPAQPGVRLTARARLRHRTGGMMFLDAEISDGARLVALATAVMKIAGKAAGDV
ncbi:PaaI family thioesterase [Pseudodonghicola flavimaris]|uniref:PaaI family thioesterase n=1 Tax=Pseudodonghicola flavimaris TaxID=3050036 RepID=A0ABT7EWW1_9RHOB|nr:PaaI family thioesterase [Pseudodonghicola flavimaris]MDK3016827.1 PaaI family thioesterase [Pseudodonghicola flavimaris]